MKENVVFDYNDDAHFRHKLLLTNRQFSNIRKAFADGLRTDIKFSLIQLSKIVQLGWSLGNHFGLLMISGTFRIYSSNISNICGHLRKTFGSGLLSDLAKWVKLIVFDEEMNDIMEIVKSLKDSALIIKVVRKAIKDEEKEQNSGFLGMLFLVKVTLIDVNLKIMNLKFIILSDYQHIKTILLKITFQHSR